MRYIDDNAVSYYIRSPMSEADKAFDWPFGEAFWIEAGKNARTADGRAVHATDRQRKFAVLKFKDQVSSLTEMARLAGFSDMAKGGLKSAGHRALRSAAVQYMLAKAKERAAGERGPVTIATANKRKLALSELIENGDATSKVKAIEALNRMELAERKLEIEERVAGKLVDNPVAILDEIAKIAPAIANALAQQDGIADYVPRTNGDVSQLGASDVKRFVESADTLSDDLTTGSEERAHAAETFEADSRSADALEASFAQE